MNGPLVGPDPGLEQLITPQGPLPQPPTPQMQQTLTPGGASGLTLGQANPQVPGNPITNEYANAIGGMFDMLQQRGLIQQPIPPQPGPGLLESLGTFGMANLKHMADEATRREQNYVRAQENRKIGMLGVGLATKMVDAQANAAALSGRANFQQLNAQLNVLRFKQQLDEYAHRVGKEQFDREFKGTRVPAPKTLQEREMYEASGMVEDPFNPAFWMHAGAAPLGGGGDAGGAGVGGAGAGGAGPTKLQRQPDGSWGIGPSAVGANTPVGQKLTEVSGGGGAGAGAAPPGLSSAELAQRPDESTTDWLRRKDLAYKTAAKTSVPTSPTRTRAEAAPKVLHLVDQVTRDLAQIKTGPFSSRLQSLGTAIGLKNPAFKRYQTDAGLLQSLVMQMHTGSRSSEMLLKKFTDMIDSGVQSPENMQAALDAIRDYATSVGKTSTTETPTTTTPPSTGAPTQSTGATQPTSLNDLLKKHGY